MRGIALAALMLFVPGAAACSMGPVPSPAAFTLVWPDGTERVVEVDGRLLGAMCDLSNPHDLEGDKFAWIEVKHNAADNPRDIHVLDLASGDEVILRDVARASIEAVGVYDDTVLAFWRDWSTMDGVRTLVAIDLETRERRAITLPAADLMSVAIDGSSVIAIVQGDPGGRKIMVYDDARRMVVAERDLAPVPSARAVSGDWFVIEGPGPDGRGSREAHRIGDGLVVPLDGSDWLVDIDGDHAYFNALDGLHRVHLPDGARETLGPTNWSLVSVHDGVRVHGRFSAPELNPLGSLWWLAQPTPQLFLLVAGVGVAGAGTAGAVWWKRRSM